MIIEDIINSIKEVTGIAPVVKGGNRSNPIEYFYSRTGVKTFRLELYLNGNDLKELMEMSDVILDSINDFYDLGKFNGSVELTGGGTFNKGSRIYGVESTTYGNDIITEVMYFNVVDYSKSVSIPGVTKPNPEPSGSGFHSPVSFPITF